MGCLWCLPVPQLPHVPTPCPQSHEEGTCTSAANSGACFSLKVLVPLWMGTRVPTASTRLRRLTACAAAAALAVAVGEEELSPLSQRIERAVARTALLQDGRARHPTSYEARGRQRGALAVCLQSALVRPFPPRLMSLPWAHHHALRAVYHDSCEIARAP